MLVAVRFSDEMLKRYLKEGIINEKDEYEEKLATLKMYEGKEHYFLSITPKELVFTRNNDITVVMRKKGGYLISLFGIAYKIFLVSLLTDHLEGGIARKHRIMGVDGVKENIKKELRAFNSFRIFGQSMYYPEEDFYEFTVVY